MILRRISADGDTYLRTTRTSPIRGKIAAFAGAGVAVAVGTTAVMSYIAVFGAMDEHELSALNSRTIALMRQVENDSASAEELHGIVDKFHSDNPGYRASVSLKERSQ